MRGGAWSEYENRKIILPEDSLELSASSCSVELRSLSEFDSVVKLLCAGLSLEFSEVSSQTSSLIFAVTSSFSESFRESLLRDLFFSLDASFSAKT